MKKHINYTKNIPAYLFMAILAISLIGLGNVFTINAAAKANTSTQAQQVTVKSNFGEFCL